MTSRNLRLICAAAALALAAALGGCRSAGAGPGSVPTETIPAPVQDSAAPPPPTETPTPALPPSPRPSPSPSPSPAPSLTATAVPLKPAWVMGLQANNLNPDAGLRQVIASGASWVRFDGFYWRDLEPEHTSPPAYNWRAASFQEARLQAVTQAGLEPIALVLYTPGWAQKYPGAACGPVAPEALAAFGDFMYALVSRYSQPPYSVTYWELGNEPDVSRADVTGSSGYGCWGEKGESYFGGEYYAEMLKAVYPRIKEADPGAVVLVGGLLLDCDPLNSPETTPGSGVRRDCASARFIEGVLRAGGADFFDGISYHAYDYYYDQFNTYGNLNWNSGWRLTGLMPVLLPKTQYLRSLLDQYEAGEKQLINTETAILCQKSRCPSETFSRAKGAYAVQSMALALALGLEANLWYSLDSGWRDTNLAGAAFTAYQTAAAWFQGAAYVGEVTLPGVNGFRFQKGLDEFWVLWSESGDPLTVTLPGAPAQMMDLLGAPIPPAGEVTLGIEPVYIVWPR